MVDEVSAQFHKRRHNKPSHDLAHSHSHSHNHGHSHGHAHGHGQRDGEAHSHHHHPDTTIDDDEASRWSEKEIEALIPHLGGFTIEILEDIFNGTGVLEDVKAQEQFSFEKDGNEFTCIFGMGRKKSAT